MKWKRALHGTPAPSPLLDETDANVERVIEAVGDKLPWNFECDDYGAIFRLTLAAIREGVD